jgi:hypothetical protein
MSRNCKDATSNFQEYGSSGWVQSLQLTSSTKRWSLLRCSTVLSRNWRNNCRNILLGSRSRKWWRLKSRGLRCRIQIFSKCSWRRSSTSLNRLSMRSKSSLGSAKRINVPWKWRLSSESEGRTRSINPMMTSMKTSQKKGKRTLRMNQTKVCDKQY